MQYNNFCWSKECNWKQRLNLMRLDDSVRFVYLFYVIINGGEVMRLEAYEFVFSARSTFCP